MKLITCLLMTITVYKFAVVEVDCGRKVPTTLIHGSSAVSAEVLISSCAVIEENVPVCQDPENTDDILYFTRTRRTPYPATGFGGDVIVAKDWMPDKLWSVGEDRDPSDTDPRTLQRAWWNFNIGPKRKPQERPNHGARPAVKTAHHDDEEPRPKTIITYSLRGCSPTIVPFNLSPCSARDASPPISVQDTDAEERAITVTSTRVVYYVPPTTYQWPQSDFSYQ